MLRRFTNGLRQTACSTMYCSVGAQCTPAVERVTKRTRIDGPHGIRLDVLDRRPGAQVTIVIHGCGTTVREAETIERRVRQAELSGTTYLLSWPSPDVANHAMREGLGAMRRTLDLILAFPTPLFMALGTGLGVFSGYKSVMAAGDKTFEVARRDAASVGAALGALLDEVPELEGGAKLNLVGHSAGAMVVAVALDDPAVAERVRDVVYLGAVTTEAPHANRRTLNVFSRSDEALTLLGRTMGNGKTDDPEMTHVELECGHAAYWDHLPSVVPKSWRAGAEIASQVHPPKRVAAPRGGGLRPHEVRCGVDRADG